MEQQPYKVYIQADGQGRITAVNSSAFLSAPVPEGWTEIDRGFGDRYHHAQGNYFDGPVTDERGVYRYAYVPDAAEGAPRWRERSREEMDADYAAVPSPPPGDAEMLLEIAGDHEYRLCLMELGVTENDLQAV